MDDPIAKFITYVETMQERFKDDKYHDHWLMHRDVLIAVKDELNAPSLFGRPIEPKEEK